MAKILSEKQKLLKKIEEYEKFIDDLWHNEWYVFLDKKAKIPLAIRDKAFSLLHPEYFTRD